MEAIESLTSKFAGVIKDVSVSGQRENVLELSDKDRLPEVANTLSAFFDGLFMLMVVDRPPKTFEMNYVFFSYSKNDMLVIRTNIDRELPVIDSISKVFKSAEWEEREAYDMFGIKFDGHPDLRRLLLPEDWPGHPLRKDFKVTEELRNWTGLDMKF